VVPPPVVVQPARDCGTGPDIGCTVSRDGRYPMDAATFSGFMRAMQSNTNEMMRAQSAQTMFTTNYATAIQFGLVLDLFPNEMVRLRIAELGAPRVVNPQHAIGYAEKFTNNMYRTGFTQLMAQQQPGGQPVVVTPVPPNPYRPPPPGPQPVPVQVRDCGTGPSDPGCMMQRNGRWAMDAVAWAGVVNSLRATMNEITREDMLHQMVANQGLTAMQLGILLDLFNNEITRLDVAKYCASRVVNPQHAYGLSTKFRNSILGQEYVTVMGAQR
jgi:hypothetical protein